MTASAATLLVIEPVVRQASQSRQAKMSDVQMMVRTGGRNRTEEELRELLGASGFVMRRTVSTDGGPDVVEASPGN
jgi:O-methyltransferase domain